MKKQKNKLVAGVGIYTKGEARGSINCKPTQAYKAWSNMLSRVYNEKTLKRTPSYSDCTVCEEWLDYQTFALWYNERWFEGAELDKDILIKGNRTYSPDTCMLVPKYINTILGKTFHNGKNPGVSWHKLTGKYIVHLNKYGKIMHLGLYTTIEEAFKVYKTAKEEYLNEYATKLYEEGKISEQVKNSLLTIEINYNII